jgi:hypothetical protein
VGSARYAWRQVGWTFGFAPPAQGQVFLVRAIAIFEWRAKKRPRGGGTARWVAVRRTKRVTRAGIRGVDGGDPPGTSRGSCYIT